MTTKNLLTSLLVLLAVAVVSCQKEPSTSGLHEDYLVYTDYDQQADFSDVETFYLPDQYSDDSATPTRPNTGKTPMRRRSSEPSPT